jgi:hypothetical protein
MQRSVGWRQDAGLAGGMLDHGRGPVAGIIVSRPLSSASGIGSPGSRGLAGKPWWARHP